MKLTRHAKNRIRRLARNSPNLSQESVLFGINSGRTLRYDDKGNRMVSIALEEVVLTVVVDETNGTVVTVWADE